MIEVIGIHSPKFIIVKLVKFLLTFLSFVLPDSLASSDLYMIMYIAHSHREPMQILLRSGN